MRKVIAIVVGVLTGFAIIFVGDATTHSLSPAPAGMDYSNRDEMREYVYAIPMYVKIIMVLFWLGSAFLGAMLAARICGRDWKRVSLITGSILFAAALLNLAMIPHPVWMWLVAVIGYIPAALFGGWLIRPKSVPLPQ